MKVEIKKLDHFGRGITFINGKIGFVENALPGEQVEIEIENSSKKYFTGKVIHYDQISPNRITPICPYANFCGGCDLQHLSYAEENRQKTQKVKELIEHFANLDKELVEEIIEQIEYHYRNKITFHSKDKKLGFYQKNTHEVIPIDKCFLANQKINKLIPSLKKIVTKNIVEKIIIRTSNDEKKVMMKITGKIKDVSDIEKKLDCLMINEKIKKGENIKTKIGKKEYFLSIDSFFQVNQILTEKLYQEVLTVVKTNHSKKVLDLYCGVGTIGLFISDEVEKVIGIDYSKDNIKNANQNKKLNQAQNIQFICDKVEHVIDSIQEQIDLVIVDPPRAGLFEKTIEEIKRISPQNLIYISCDPVTLARDLKSLTKIFEVNTIKPYNMFPRTYHVECVCLLSRKKKIK